MSPGAPIARVAFSACRDACLATFSAASLACRESLASSSVILVAASVLGGGEGRGRLEEGRGTERGSEGQPHKSGGGARGGERLFCASSQYPKPLGSRTGGWRGGLVCGWDWANCRSSCTTFSEASCILAASCSPDMTVGRRLGVARSWAPCVPPRGWLIGLGLGCGVAKLVGAPADESLEFGPRRNTGWAEGISPGLGNLPLCRWYCSNSSRVITPDRHQSKSPWWWERLCCQTVAAA